MKGGAERQQAGFTLIELAVLLVILGMLLMVVFYAIPKLTERNRLENTRTIIDQAAAALTGFAASHARLPCPDVNGDGLEGTGGVCADTDVVGRVPYRDLGLADPVLDKAHLPVRYAVYRRPSDDPATDADLAVLVNRFVPVLPGDPATLSSYNGLPDDPKVQTPTKGINKVRVTPNVTNDLDFCLALRNAKAATASTSYVHTLDLDGAAPSFNAAFVLASGGVEDANGDGVDIAFDGVNEGSTGVDFESPARRRGVGYDDLVFAMPFERLESRMSCTAITVSVTSAANVAIAAAHGLVQGEDTVWSAELAVTMAQIAVASASFAVALSAISVWVAANNLAAASAACLAGLPGCGGESFAAAGVALATVSAAAATAAVTLAAVALDQANSNLDGPKDRLPGMYNHAPKALQDAEDANTRGGQM